jgi:hypothetical protein
MSNNPYEGHVPLRRPNKDESLTKAKTLDETSYRPGTTHPVEYRNQYTDPSITPRNTGCTILRRYPNGKLCFEYVVHEIYSLLNKVRDGGKLTQYEKAVLSLTLPKPFGKLIDSKIAQTMTKLSKDERLVLGHMIGTKMREEANWNAGRGGGSVPGRSSTRS